ncbi:SCP-2 sterol transfer family protein [Palleronia salina]|uniref:SCP-2 sterol transfer family protein n=2 Tax=Palleronia TaxID=315422 RepID=A0A1M6JCR8_9RHOB|nr:MULTISPECIES: SCP2 sterol-binding domain-containing protein [Palleronia]SEN96395.1 SCP-2 sterol transfer family protein [Palleronia pelagia]SHJ44497.1 SCP-2 sterol transfer family protein [Palleronia salina]
MSDVINAAVEQLNAKVGGSYDGSAKFVIEDEGSIMLDDAGARAADEDAEVTMTADADTFKEIMDGELDPTQAFMTGRLTIDGDMGQAMKLAQVL